MIHGYFNQIRLSLYIIFKIYFEFLFLSPTDYVVIGSSDENSYFNLFIHHCYKKGTNIEINSQNSRLTVHLHYISKESSISSL